jgi:predicted RNA-binding Zn-ribbon protein involved in translation (DUF1610 family)
MPKRSQRLGMNSPEPLRRDRASVARRIQLEEAHVREAEMEARSVLGGAPQSVSVACPSCHQRSEFAVTNAAPVAPCPNCGVRLVLRAAAPVVVNR